MDVVQAIPTAKSVVPGTRMARPFWLGAAVTSAVLISLPLVFRLNGKPHADWEQFLGRFHPLIVHLPIGLIVLVPLLELMGRFRPALREAAGFVLPLSALASIGAVCLGFLLAYGGGSTGAVLTRHMWGGIGLTVGTLCCCLLRPAWASGGVRGIWSWSYPAALTVVLLLLSWAAHQGGSLTHGENYLFEYVPGPLKRFLPREASRPQAAVDTASFYGRHIHPMLDARCASCHGDGNVKGGLRVDTYELLMKGGQEGVVVIAGQPEKSILLERVLLPSDHKKFMPSEGKPPLKPEEILWLKTWIAQGASATATSLTGLAIAERVEEAPLPRVADYSQVLPAMTQIAATAGVKLMPVSKNPSDGLILNAVDASSSFTDAQLAAFSPYGEYIVEVELGRTSVTNACFQTLARFPHLRAIHLEATPITGDGLALLTQLPEMSYLNLSGTQVTAATVAPLASDKTLRHLYLYNTPAQPVTSTPSGDARPQDATPRKAT